MASQPDISALAADECSRRQATARRKLAQGALAPREANALLLPWIALAVRAGSDLPDLAEALAEVSHRGKPDKPFFSEAEARAHLADEFCPRPIMIKALAAAAGAAILRHEAALATGDSTHLPRARALADLAAHFGVVPHLPAQEQAA